MLGGKKYKIKYIIRLPHDLKEFLKSLPKVSSNEIEILYENEIYDGPVEGLCLWKKRKYYFVDIEEPISAKSRKYFLIKLEEEQLKNEESLYDFFKKSVDLDQYYKVCEQYPDQTIDKKQIVAWFELK